jgi:hypothetical protein
MCSVRCFVPRKLRDEGRTVVFPEMAGSRWASMKTSGFWPILLGKILCFIGSLFEQATALPLNVAQFSLLRARTMFDSERFKLLYLPYVAPKCESARADAPHFFPRRNETCPERFHRPCRPDSPAKPRFPVRYRVPPA